MLKGNSSQASGEISAFVSLVSDQIKPFNSVGLMDSSKKNMYEHTAVTL